MYLLFSSLLSFVDLEGKRYCSAESAALNSSESYFCSTGLDVALVSYDLEVLTKLSIACLLFKVIGIKCDCLTCVRESCLRIFDRNICLLATANKLSCCNADTY